MATKLTQAAALQEAITMLETIAHGGSYSAKAYHENLNRFKAAAAQANEDNVRDEAMAPRHP